MNTAGVLCLGTDVRGCRRDSYCLLNGWQHCLKGFIHVEVMFKSSTVICLPEAGLAAWGSQGLTLRNTPQALPSFCVCVHLHGCNRLQFIIVHLIFTQVHYIDVCFSIAVFNIELNLKPTIPVTTLHNSSNSFLHLWTKKVWYKKKLMISKEWIIE